MDVQSMKHQIEEHQRVVAAAAKQVELLARIADRVIACFDAGGKLYVFGNGGSAADAQHIAAELVGRFKRDRKALPAIALTTDTSILTAVTNDLGGEHNFVRQVEALVTDRDIVWASASRADHPTSFWPSKPPKRSAPTGSALPAGRATRSGNYAIYASRPTTTPAIGCRRCTNSPTT